MNEDLTGRKNMYVCTGGHATVVVHLDHGVTPMFWKCPTCGERSESMFYPKAAQAMTPTHEWYKPRGKAYRALSDAMKAHVDKGGLDVRQIAQPESRAGEK